MNKFNLFDFSDVKPSWSANASLNPFGASVAPKSVSSVRAPFAPGATETYDKDITGGISVKPEISPQEVSQMDSFAGISPEDLSAMDAEVGKTEQPAEQPVSGENDTFASNFKMKSSEDFWLVEWAKDVAKFFINVPADSLEVVEQLGKAALHPIDTVTGMLKTGQGLSDKAVYAIGNSIVRQFGGKEVPPTEEAKMIDAIGEKLKQDYGTAGKLKKAVVENPADVLLTVMGGLGVAKDIAEANGLASTVSKIDKLQQVVNPVNVLKQEAGVVGKLGSAVKSGGESLYKSAITPTVREAELMQKAEAGLGKAPVTRADTALQEWIAGTESRIGVESLKKADEIWNTKIQPFIQQSTATHSIDDIFNSVKKSIGSQETGALRKTELNEALDALKADYKATGKTSFSTNDLQLEKSTLDEFTPSKIWKGKEVANGYNQVKNALANEMRARVRDDLGKFGVDAKSAYRDYANLKELSKIGVKAATESGLRGGFGNFWSTAADMLLTPVKTYGGKTLYKVGDALEFVWPKGLKKFGDFLKGKVKVGAGGELVPMKTETPTTIKKKAPVSIKAELDKTK